MKTQKKQLMPEFVVSGIMATVALAVLILWIEDGHMQRNLDAIAETPFLGTATLIVSVVAFPLFVYAVICPTPINRNPRKQTVQRRVFALALSVVVMISLNLLVRGRLWSVILLSAAMTALISYDHYFPGPNEPKP